MCWDGFCVRKAAYGQYLCIWEPGTQLGDLLFAVTLSLGGHGTAPHDNHIWDDGVQFIHLIYRGWQLHDIPACGGILRLQVKRFSPVQSAPECHKANSHRHIQSFQLHPAVLPVTSHATGCRRNGIANRKERKGAISGDDTASSSKGKTRILPCTVPHPKQAT